MPSLSFDPVAHTYDATRGYPESVARQIAAGIVAAVKATPQTKFLEVGVGTGRIAYPLSSLGHNYTGVDISETTMTPRRALENVTKRLWSSTWAVPDDLFAASVERLEQWANEQSGDKMDVEHKELHRFVISKTQL